MWSAEKNQHVFGPCANENWHGHNFELIVTVKGEVDLSTGYLVDLKSLSDLIKKEVLLKVDHKNINLDVEFMQGKMASCENIVIEFWQILQPKIPEISNQRAILSSISLHETANNFVEYSGVDS